VTGETLDSGRMTLVEHLTELRRRIIICACAIVACSVLMFALYNQVLSILSAPYEDITHRDLIVTGPLEPFLVRLKIAAYGGIALSIPLIFWEIWRFVTPGLHKHERRYGIAFLFSSIVLFLMGAAVAWLTLPKALDFLLGVGGDSIEPMITADKYLTLVTLMIIAFGVAFEFPLLLIFLLMTRIISTNQLRRSRRWMAVGITAFAAVITPSQDPFSLLFMAVPMYLFFEIAIVIGRVMKR
jgi:sec-independent protein translocase protein TatC